MNFIQFLIIALSLSVIIKVISSFKKRSISLRSLLFWVALWSAVLLVFLLPKTADYLAKMLGFWRGADVAVYFSVILIFYLIFRIFVKLEKIESDITAIVREIALKEKKQDEKKN